MILAEVVALIGKKDSQSREQAFNLLYVYYQQPIERYFRVTWGYDLEQASDLCQDTFVRALKDLRRKETILLQTANHLKNWLYRIAKSVAIDDLRRKKPVGYLPTSDSEAYPQIPELMVEGHEEQVCKQLLIEDAKAAVSSQYRECLQMQLDGYTLKETAEKLGIADKTVSANVSRAKTQLQRTELHRIYYPVAHSLQWELLSLCRDVDAYYGGPFPAGALKVHEQLAKKIGKVPPYKMKQRIEKSITEVESYLNRVNDIWRKLGSNLGKNRVNDIWQKRGSKDDSKEFLVIMELEKIVYREQGYEATYSLTALAQLCLDQINLRTCRECNERFERVYTTVSTIRKQPSTMLPIKPTPPLRASMLRAYLATWLSL